MVSARSEPALQDLAASHAGRDAATGATILPVALDVTDAASVAAAARTVLAQGPLDLVLYCAGHYRAQRATAFDLPDMLRHLQVNYAGALRVLDARAAVHAGARRRPHQPGQQRGRLSRPAARPGLRPHQGGTDQPGRNAVP